MNSAAQISTANVSHRNARPKRRPPVTDAAATVRARRQELANPSAYFTTRERAEERLREAMLALANAMIRNDDHGVRIDIG